MKILTRYILAELLKWFLLSLTVLTLIILVFFVAREAIKRGLPPEGVVRLIPCFLPMALSFAVPGTLLLATTSVYARMAGSNEVLAIKSQGISPRKILEPIWALAFVASLVTVVLGDVAASWGRNQVHHVLVDSVEDIVYRMLATHRQYSAAGISINVKDVVDRRLIRPVVSLKAHGTRPAITVTADEAELSKDVDRGEAVLKFVFHRPHGDVGTRGSIMFPEKWPLILPLEDVSQASSSARMPSYMPLRAIPEAIVDQEAEIDRCEQSRAARAACEMLRGDFDALTDKGWQTRTNQLRAHQGRLFRLHVEPHRRWSGGFSCLCFAWVGAPMAIRLRNRDMLTSFFLCFMPILVVYYPLLIFGINGAKEGQLPPWSVWAGNLLLVAWGCHLLRKVVRY